MADIRTFIQSHLLEPLKQYPTVIQDTMIEIITQRLQTLYDYTVKFPEILSPSTSRLDILQAIADQFLFTVREDADIQEQVDILDKILYVYNKRGSIDTIENMWKYYGGKLPKEVKVIIPSYNLFRYSVSALSGSHVFVKGLTTSITLDTPAPVDIPSGSIVLDIDTRKQKVTTGVAAGSYSIPLTSIEGMIEGSRVRVADIYEGTIESALEDKSTINRPGVYEIRLTNNTYPIPDLKEFLIKELVAAGNYIYFTNSLHADLTDTVTNTSHYRYSIQTEDLLQLQMSALKSQQGLTWSGYNPLSRNSEDSYLSGRGSIFLEITRILESPNIDLSTYRPYDTLPQEEGFLSTLLPNIRDIRYLTTIYTRYDLQSFYYLYCTPEDDRMYIENYLYNNDGDIIESHYPGYFVLGKTLLDSAVS